MFVCRIVDTQVMEAMRSSLNYSHNHKICIVSDNTKMRMKLRKKSCLFLSNSNRIAPLNFSVRAAHINVIICILFTLIAYFHSIQSDEF